MRVEAKICELCGVGFFRQHAERECKRCAAKLAQPPAPIPPITAADRERTSKGLHYPKMRAAAYERARKRREERSKRQREGRMRGPRLLGPRAIQ